MDLSENNMQADSGIVTPPSLESRLNFHGKRIVEMRDELGVAFKGVRSQILELKNSARDTAVAVETLAAQVASLAITLREAPVSRTSPPNTDLDEADPERGYEYFDDGFSPRAPLPIDPRYEPKFPCPKTFSGDFSLCRGFLGQCELFFRHQPTRYAAPETRVALVVSLLAGRALQWAMAAVSRNQHLSTHYDDFLREFKLVFDHPEDGHDAATRLHDLRQGSRSVADYTVEFRILAAESAWGEVALQSAYRKGLSENIKDLILQKRPPTLNALITLALQVDERVQERRRKRARAGSTHRPTVPKTSSVVVGETSKRDSRSPASSP